MTKKERAEYIGHKLNELYPEVPIPLDHTDAFTLLIAVLLSAQCTDKRVNLVTPALFAKASTPQDMRNLSVEEIPDYYKERCALKTNINPADIANAAVFLVSEKSAKITGAILSVDGGVAFVR